MLCNRGQASLTLEMLLSNLIFYILLTQRKSLQLLSDLSIQRNTLISFFHLLTFFH